MLGGVVNVKTLKDLQPNSHMGHESCPFMKRHAISEPLGVAYAAVGKQGALDSEIDFPNKPTSALAMLSFLIPADVSNDFIP